MKKRILSGLVATALTVGTGYALPVSAAEATDDAVQTYVLDDIVVTASRSETAISDVPADVTLITEEQIERGNYKSVSDALKGANVNVVQKGFAAYPVINGDSRVLVMVDGKKVNWDHLMVSGDDNAINVDQVAIGDVERIEIVRGPNSSLYGERAVSGVVNIITKSPTSGKPTGSFNMQAGTWGERRGSIYVSGGDEKNSIKASIAHERRNNYKYKNSDGKKLTFPDSNIHHTDYTLGFDHVLGDDRLSFDYARNESKDGFGNYLTNPKEGIAYGQGTKSVQTNEMYGVTYHFGVKKEGEGTFLRYYHKTSEADSPLGTAPYMHDLKSDTFEGQKLWQLNDKNMLIGGFLWTRDSLYENNDGSPMDKSATTKALFLEDDWQLGQGFSLKLGTRYEHHSDFGGDSASHISLNKKFSRGTHAYISWGQAINNPTLKMRYADTPYMKGNPDLKQERSHTFTIGADSQITRKWNISGSLYWSKVKNALNWAWNREGDFKTHYYNTETENRRGLELSTRYQASRVWTLRAAYSYAYVDSTDVNKAYLSTNTRPNGYNLGISYTQGKWEADADLNYVTGRSTARFTDARYLTLDLGVNYQITDAFKVYLKGMNLTDEHYESIGYSIIGAYAMPSRHFILGGTYNF